MGECADMVLDGILDWDGDYTGNSRVSRTSHNPQNYNKVFCLFKSWSVKKERRWEIIHAYGNHIITERKLTPNQKINFLNEAAENWKHFKNFVKEYLGNK